MMKSRSLGLCASHCNRVCVSELKFNLDVHLSFVRLKQGAYFFRQEPGHLDKRKRQKERKERIYYTPVV